MSALFGCYGAEGAAVLAEPLPMWEVKKWQRSIAKFITAAAKTIEKLLTEARAAGASIIQGSSGESNDAVDTCTTLGSDNKCISEGAGGGGAEVKARVETIKAHATLKLVKLHMAFAKSEAFSQYVQVVVPAMVQELMAVNQDPAALVDLKRRIATIASPAHFVRGIIRLQQLPKFKLR
jgi:hypothetical protein